MIKVECPGCKAPYQVDERRVPDAGLKMRCPKCATTFVVNKPGAAPAAGAAQRAAAQTAPAVPKPTAPKPAAPAPPAPKADARGRDVMSDAEWDLPAPAPQKQGGPPHAEARGREGAEWDLPAPVDRGAPAYVGGAPAAGQKRPSAPALDDDGDSDMVDLPIVAPRAPAPPRQGAPAAKAPPPAAKPAAPKPAAARGFGEIDLLVDLPAPGADGDAEIDLPVARDVPAPPRGAPPPAAPKPAAAKSAGKAAPPANRNKTQLFGDTVPDPANAPQAAPAAAPIRVPVPARGSAPAQPPPRARPSSPEPAPRAPMDSGLDFGPPAARPAVDPKRAAARTVPDPERMFGRAAPEPPARAPMDSGLEFGAAPEPLGFGEIDLPLLASEADLPAPSQSNNLPSPAAGLPVTAAGLPSPVEGAALPARPTPGLPMATGGTSLPVPTDGTTLPVRMQRVPTPISDPRLAGANFSADLDGPAVHGPGHVAGADLYTGPAAYDERHMDPAFQTSGRNLPPAGPQPAARGSSPGGSPPARASSPGGSPSSRSSSVGASPPARASSPGAFADENDGEEAVFMTTSGAPVAGRKPDVTPKMGTEPRIANAEPRLARGAAQAGLGDLIDRTSIELDLIESAAPPGNDANAARQPAARQSAPAAQPSAGMAAPPPQQRIPTPEPLSVPDLAASLDAPRPPSPRFDVDPLGEPNSGVFPAPDAGTEAPLAADDVGDEAELDGKSPAGRGPSAQKTAASKADPNAAETPPKKRPWVRYIVGVGVAGLFAGAMGGFVPDVGPFGLNFVSDRVNAKLQNGALDTVRSLVQADLEADISAGADRALGKMKTGQQAYPRHRATAGYAAFVAYSRGLRFGARAEDKAYGDMMVRVSRDRQTDFLLLGQAAQDAASGQIARSRQTIQGLLQRRPDDIDVAVLAGEVELLARSGDQATKAWQHAVDIKKVPRTLFGLARAQFAAHDLIGAEASAKSALDMSPKHVGARTLLAGIVWQNGNREQQALELLGKVTEDGEIRASAGDPELVLAYTQLGFIHLAKSRMTQAEAAFAAALKIDPQAVNALVGNGELFYQSGRFTEAVARYEAAMRADADSVPAKIGMAKTLLHLERAKDAKDLLKKLCDARPNEAAAFSWLGAAEETLGNKKEAEAAYTTAIKVGADSPDAIEAYVALARLLSSLGRIDDAKARLNEANARFPGMPALFRARGDVALATGNYEEAKKEFEAALARADDLGTKFKLATTLRRMHAYEDATHLFDTIAEADKDFPGLALERGLLFEETGQSERATEMYAKALQAAPNDLDLKLRVGSTQVMAGHAKQAEAILRDVLRAKPNSAEVNHFLGRALLVRGTSLAEAKRFLERAAEIDPNRAEYHLYVGWVANELGETTLAESALRRAVELDRNLGDAYWQRAVLLQKQGQSLDALKDLKIALEKSPSRYEIYATMASCHQDQSHWPEAEEAWRKAIAGNDQNAEWHYRLAKTYEVRGNTAARTQELEKAVTLAEAPDKAAPGWLAQAHYNLGEAYQSGDHEKAKHHFLRYQQLAPQNDPYRDEAAKALQRLGN